MATYIKVNGTWQTVSGDTASVCGYVKVDGTWRTVTNTYVKIDGTWRSVCAPVPTPTPTPGGGGGVSDPPQDSSVSGLSPNNGAAAGGYTVKLNGSFVSNLTNISVNGTNLGSFSRLSSTEYSFTMPAGTQGTTVQVQAYNGRVPVMSSLTFTYNSEGSSGVTCTSPNYCSTIQYSDGTNVTINATNGTFNGSLQTEACGNGGTRTKAYTCITPAGCPNISVGAGQCTGESGGSTTYYYVSGCCAQNTNGEINQPAYGVSTSGFGAALSNATSACYYSLTNVQYSNSTYPSVSCGSSGGTSCSCTPLTTTTGTRSVSTTTCQSGIMNTSTSTYNQCCVTNGTVTATSVTSDTGCVPYSPPVTCGSCGAQNNIQPDVEYNVCNGVQLCSTKTTTYQRKYCTDGTYSYDCAPVVTYSGCVNSSTCGYVASCTCNYAGAGYCVNGVTYAPECCEGTGCCTQGPACGGSSGTTWYCTTSVNSNCAGCTQSTSSTNISSSGSGYSTACSTSGYPSCGTPCSTPSPSPTPTPTPSANRICSRSDYINQCCSCFSEGACDANGSLSSC